MFESGIGPGIRSDRFGTWSLITFLLVFVPVSLVFEFVLKQPVAIFATSCVAILPLAALLGRATDELAGIVGSALDGR